MLIYTITRAQLRQRWDIPQALHLRIVSKWRSRVHPAKEVVDIIL